MEFQINDLMESNRALLLLSRILSFQDLDARLEITPFRSQSKSCLVREINEPRRDESANASRVVGAFRVKNGA